MNSKRMMNNAQSYPDIVYWLILHLAPKFGLREWRNCLRHFPNPKAFCESDLAKQGLSEETINAIEKPDYRQIDHVLAWVAAPQHTILTLHDDAYPFLLKQIATAPPIIYIDGNPSLLASTQIAVVGTRKPSFSARELAFKFASELSQFGLVITSGLALGIDTAAHRGALSNRAATIAVLGSGIDVLYPAKNQELGAEIRNNGAIISEFPLSTPPLPHHFPQRNRIIAGLSLGTLVVEAALKSGSLVTARLAANEGREVFAVPGSVQNPMTTGCHHLIQQGAKLVTSIDDILIELTSYLSNNHPTNRKDLMEISTAAAAELDIDHQKLLECIGFERTSFEQLVNRSGLTTQNVLVMLCNLKLNGYIKEDVGGFIRVIT